MPTRHPAFLVAVDTENLSVTGYPAPRHHGDVILAFSGYLHGRDSSPPVDDLRTLAKAYGSSGPDLTATLLGAYAAVIVDPRQRLISLVQDSLGLQPVFFSQIGTSLEVSTRLEWLAARAPSSTIDEEYFAEYLLSAQYPQMRTPYSSIRRLSGGHALTFSARGHRRCWRPWSPASERRVPPWEQAAEEVAALVTEAVEGQLPDRGHVACELSGGLDSTTVFVTARQRRTDVSALTVVNSASPVANDDEMAAAVVSSAGATWHRLDVALYPPYASVPDQFSPEPGTEIDYGIRQPYRQFLTTHRVYAVLSGLGGDIIFGGPGSRPLFLADAVSSGRLIHARQLSRRWSETARPRRHWSKPLLQAGVTTAWRHWRRHRLNLAANAPAPGWLAPGLRDAGRPQRWRRQQLPRVSRPSQQLMWELIHETAVSLGAARHPHLNVEMRHPLLYRPLVEYMAALDTAFTFSPEGDRRLQRIALADRLPSLIRDRTSKGNPQHGYDLALARSGAWFSALTNESRLVSRGLVVADEWQAELARARLGVIPNRPQLEASMMAEWWLRSIETCSPSPCPTLANPVSSEHD